MLRHSHATRQIDLGAPAKVVGDILGHVRPEPLVDAETVARFLAVDTATVYRLARRAALPGIQVAPRVLRFRPDDVRGYLERRTRKAPQGGRVKRLLGAER